MMNATQYTRDSHSTNHPTMYIVVYQGTESTSFCCRLSELRSPQTFVTCFRHIECTKFSWCTKYLSRNSYVNVNCCGNLMNRQQTEIANIVSYATHITLVINKSCIVTQIKILCNKNF